MIGAFSAHNWTKFWTKFQQTKTRFSLPDRGGIGQFFAMRQMQDGHLIALTSIK
jgi:hypothetical protein